MIPKVDTELYICEKFLDLVEKKPFYRIKVKELVEYAEIGRSTFYMYFDSIYSVMQKIEDDFLEDFLDEDAAVSIFIHGNTDLVIKQNLLIREKSRTFLLLLGANGDSSFQKKLEDIVKKMTYAVLHEQGIATVTPKTDFLASYLAAGTLSTFKWIAEHRDLDPAEALSLAALPLNDISRHLTLEGNAKRIVFQ